MLQPHALPGKSIQPPEGSPRHYAQAPLMRKIRRVRKCVETRESIIVRTTTSGFDAVCPQCGNNSRMVAPEEAARLFGIPVRYLFRQLEAGTVHFIESPSGALLICLNSVSKP